MKKTYLYRHIRIINNDELIFLIQNRIEPTNIRDIPQKKIGTICISYDENGEFRIGISICSKDDNFSRKLGREISLDRCDNNPQLIKKLGENLPDEVKYKTSVELLNILENAISSNINEFRKNLKSLEIMLQAI